jgi:hypothetical protein
MKKILLLLFVFVFIFPFKNDKIFSNCVVEKNYQQTRSFDAFLWWGNRWVRGYIDCQVSQYGYVPIKYYFDAGVGSNFNSRGNFYQGDKFIPLNPNHELAKKNNWTHYIKVQGSNAYLTLY